MLIMYQDSKYSKFLFHLKFSQTDDFVHEHELYEVMRSRNLYQTQFGVRSNYKKIMRNLAKDEKQRKYGFENSRKLFLQKMKERREQIDKIRIKTSNQVNRLSVMQEKDNKQIQRRYVPIPQSTTVYTEFPLIESQDGEGNPSKGPDDKYDDATVLPPAPSPSMVGTVYTDDGIEEKEEVITKHYVDYLNPSYKPHLLFPGSKGHRTRKNKLSRSMGSDMDSGISPIPELTDNDVASKLENLRLDQDEKEDLNNTDNEFERKTKLGEGKAHTSTIYITDDPPTRLRTSRPFPSESKVKVWADKHGIAESRDNIRKEADFQKFLIDRPSKWAVNNYGDIIQTNIDMKLQYSRRMLNEKFMKKYHHFDQHADRVSAQHVISLPELNTTPKPMVCLETGGTTPDGKLILTKADYEEYLSGYRKARDVRLEKSKQNNRLLEKRINDFTLEPTLCLKDDTPLRSSLNTI